MAFQQASVFFSRKGAPPGGGFVFGGGCLLILAQDRCCLDIFKSKPGIGAHPRSLDA